MFLISINVGNLGIELSGNNQIALPVLPLVSFPRQLCQLPDRPSLFNGKGCYLRMPINRSQNNIIAQIAEAS
jgi:hypothetical protein